MTTFYLSENEVWCSLNETVQLHFPKHIFISASLFWALCAVYILSTVKNSSLSPVSRLYVLTTKAWLPLLSCI